MSKKKYWRKLEQFRKLNEGSRFFRFVVALLTRIIEIKTVRVLDEGSENIPSNGPAIVIAPHSKEFDSLLAPQFVTRCGRMPRIMAKASLWKIPVVKQAFNSGKLIPVVRDSKDASKALEGAAKALIDGDVVFIFPEGTCTKDPDSWPMTCKTGAARLALQMKSEGFDIPLILISSDGIQNLKSKPKPTKSGKVEISMKCYNAIDYSKFDYSEKGINELNNLIENELTKTVAELRGIKEPDFRYNAKTKQREHRA